MDFVPLSTKPLIYEVEQINTWFKDFNSNMTRSLAIVH